MPNALFAAYLDGKAGDFFDLHYGRASDRHTAVARAARPVAAAVHEVLAAQNARFPTSRRRAQHLAALRNGALAAVTGQQVGLFLGPLFTIYKAATAIAVARALSDETGRPVVPIFWLQTEDHDLAEIAQTHVPGHDGTLRSLRLAVSPANRGSVAHQLLPDEIAACLSTLHGELHHLPHAQEHLQRLQRHYVAGQGWATAFAAVLAELFSEEGLILFDAREPRIAGLTAPLHRRAIDQAAQISALLEQRSRELEASGFTAMVHVRRGAPLSFFHPLDPVADRYRLQPSEGSYEEVGGNRRHSLAALHAALDADPLHFSSSALLRPIIQDSLLPVAAYVGGPAEVGYFAQLAPLYRFYDLPPPLVVPRARLRLIDDRMMQLLTRLGLHADDMSRPEEELLAQLQAARDEAPEELLGARLLAPFTTALESLRPQLESAGPGLDAAVTKTRATVEMAVGKLAQKLRSARLHHNQTLVEQVRRLKAMLQPNGEPQERFYGPAYFAARYGERQLIEMLLHAITPFDARPRDVLCAAAREAAPA